IRRNRSSGGSGKHAGNVGVHVLGRGVPGRAFSLYCAAEYVRRRSGRWIEDLHCSVPDAGASTKLNVPVKLSGEIRWGQMAGDTNSYLRASWDAARCALRGIGFPLVILSWLTRS